MKKAKIFFIILISIAVALVTVATILLAPLVGRLISPIWEELIKPFNGYLSLIIFAIASFWLACKYWKWWLKLMLFLLGISAVAEISGTSLITIMSSPWYQVLGIVFVLLSVLAIADKKWQKEQDKGISGKDKESSYSVASFVLMIAAIVVTIFFFIGHQFDLWGLALTISIIVELVITFASIEDEDGSVLSAVFQAIVILALSAVMLFSNSAGKSDFMSITKNEVSKNKIENFLSQNNVSDKLKIENTEIPFPDAVVSIDKKVTISKDSRGFCTIVCNNAKFDESFSLWKDYRNNFDFSIETSEGYINVPAKSLIKLDERNDNQVVTIVFKTEFSVN